MRAIRFLFAFLLLSGIFCKSSFAATFTFNGSPSTLNENDTFLINANLDISGSSGNIYYIKGVFSHSDTPTSYLGYTKNNNGDWQNDDQADKFQYYKVIMDASGQWSGSIEFKLDTQDSSFKGSGNYNFKLGRYTASGTSPTWCTSESTPCDLATISVIAPTPTPTLTLTPTSTPSHTPTPTKSPTLTPTIKLTSTPTPIILPISSKTPTPKPTSVSLISSTRTPTSISTIPTENSQDNKLDVLGSSTENFTPTIQEVKKDVMVVSSNSNNLIGKVFIALGVIFLSLCGIVLFWSYKKSKEDNNEI